MSDQDWRLTGQDRYLTGVAVAWHEWSAPPPGRGWRLEDGSVLHSRFRESGTSGVLSAGYTPAPSNDGFGRAAAEQDRDHEHGELVDQAKRERLLHDRGAKQG